MKVDLRLSTFVELEEAFSSHASHVMMLTFCILFVRLLDNIIALRNAKIVYNFGLPECNRVQQLCVKNRSLSYL